MEETQVIAAVVVQVYLTSLYLVAWGAEAEAAVLVAVHQVVDLAEAEASAVDLAEADSQAEDLAEAGNKTQ